MKHLSFTILLFAVFASNVSAQDSLSFNSLSDMTTNRFGFGYSYDGEFIYAVSGGKSVSPWRSTTLERYSMLNNNWDEFVTGLIPRRYCSTEFIESLNKIFLFNGGSGSTITDTVEIVNVSTGALTYSASNPFPVEYAGSAVWNNKIYIFGGSNDDGYSNRLYEFDPATLEWTIKSSMPEAKQTSGRIVDGKIYAFGGYNGSASKRIDRYDIQTDTWTFIGEMPVAISAHGTAVFGKHIWLVGSYDNLKSLAVFNTETYEFTQLKSNMTDRRHAGTIAIGDSLFVLGGAQTSSSISALNSLEVANIHAITTSINQDMIVHPERYNLLQNYPNPFNPETTIEFSITKPEKISLTVYNLLGKNVATLVNKKLSSGIYKYTFNAKNLPSGTYFYKLTTKSGYLVMKMLLIQ